LAQPKLSSRGLSYLCRVKPSGLSLQIQIKFGFGRGSVRTLDWAKGSASAQAEPEVRTKTWLRPNEKFDFTFRLISGLTRF